MPKLQRSSQWTWCCLAVLSTALSASAQISPNESQSAPRLIPRTKAERDAQYSFHHRILLNVQVTDSSGHPVIGLNAGDFNLQINKSPQAITTFKAVADSGNTAKAHAFLIVDLLNNSARDLAHGYRAIKALAGSNRLLPMPTSIAVLTDKGFEVSSASRNADELAAHWKEATKDFHLNDCTEDWNNAGMGKAIATMGSLDDVNRAKNREDAAARIGNCLNEKYQLSFTALVGFAHRQQNVPGRAILIWIGPGWPILSGNEFSPETPYLRESFFANLVNASTELREGQVTLDAVSWPASSPVSKVNYSELDTLTRDTSTAAQASARSVAMPVLAHISGGQTHLREKNLTPKLAACLEDATSYYVLGFDSPPSSAANEFRVIEISVHRPGLTVRTNTGYYAQP